MTVYSGPVFDMAVQQFGVIANHLSIPMDERERILMPKRAITVSCPIHRDDGSIAVFEGYRVQHHLTLGPTKGGTRFAPSVDIGEVAALAIWMSWKCALAGLPYGGAKGGVRVDPASISKRELEGLSRRYMQEMIPFVGPHTDVMAPGHGHQRAGDGVVHGYLLHVPGPHRHRDRHRQAGKLGRHARSPRGHRPRRCSSRPTRHEATSTSRSAGRPRSFRALATSARMPRSNYTTRASRSSR